MTVKEPGCPEWQTAHRELLSKLFHALNQPLTALNCALELAILRPPPLEEFQETLRQAASQVMQISQLTGYLRQIMEAEDPGDHLQFLDLGESLRHVVAEMIPVAEAIQSRIDFRCEVECAVWFEKSRLKESLFSLLDLALASTRGEVLLELKPSGEPQWALLHIATLLKDVSPWDEAGANKLCRQVGLFAAYRRFEKAGARLTTVCENNCLEIRIQLPVIDLAR